MTSFASLLSSISGQPQAPTGKPAETSSKPPGNTPVPANALSVGARPTTSNAVAGVKRKPEDQAAAPQSKVVKTEVNVPVRASGQSSTTKANPATAPVGEYRGTARASGVSTSTTRPIARPTPRPGQSQTPAAQTPATASNGAPKAKRGFASLMEKAKAAQEAAKAAGSTTIKHKPVERMSKREQRRMQEEAAKQQKAGGRTSKLAVSDRSRSNTPMESKAGSKKGPEPAYKGTMKKPVERQEFTYKGTMRKVEPGGAKTKKPGLQGRDSKYNGYVSWSDLDEAEDEEEEGYDSESDMDAGFDDMESEERMALAVARKEDQEALEEEERHKREKMERKRRLQALNKSAAARKKF